MDHKRKCRRVASLLAKVRRCSLTPGAYTGPLLSSTLSIFVTVTPCVNRRIPQTALRCGRKVDECSPSVETIKTRVQSAYGFCNQRLKLENDEPLSNFEFRIKLRRYNEALVQRAVDNAPVAESLGEWCAVLRTVRHEVGGVTDNKHSTDVGCPPPPPRIPLRFHPEGKSCGRVRTRFECLLSVTLLLGDGPQRGRDARGPRGRRAKDVALRCGPGGQGGIRGRPHAGGGGLQSSTSQLNLSQFWSLQPQLASISQHNLRNFGTGTHNLAHKKY